MTNFKKIIQMGKKTIVLIGLTLFMSIKTPSTTVTATKMKMMNRKKRSH